MNVYDFDKTIYSHDSTVDFFKFLAKRQPLALVLNVPCFITGGLGYILHLHSPAKLHPLKDQLIYVAVSKALEELSNRPVIPQPHHILL